MDEFLIVPDFSVDGFEVMGLDGFPGDAVFWSKRNLLGVEASMMRIPDPFLICLLYTSFFVWYFRKVLVVTALLTMARRFHSYTLEKAQAHPKTTTIG